jgi:hypothetical protein
MEDMVSWYAADGPTFTDTSKTTSAVPGDLVAAVTDMGPYGHDMVQATSAWRPNLIVDNGAYAFQFSQSVIQWMATEAAVAGTTLMFAVIRSPSPYWTSYAAPLGRFSDAARPYLFSAGHTAFNDLPASLAHRNGVSIMPGGEMSPITSPMLITLDWVSPGYSQRLVLGQTNPDVWSSDLIVYEVLTYSSILTPGDITDIEALLMTKYGIV